MAHIAKNILSTIGNTPLVRLERLVPGQAKVLAKVESFNPGGSAKDRVALAMIATAEASGELKPGGTIIEPTSGNTGVGLALVAAVRGYHVILTMPDNMSAERRKLAKAFGAEIVLTPAADGMKGAIAKAEELKKSIGGALIPQQFDNPANPVSHYTSTGPEIWRDTDGQVDVLVATAGTGGTLSGTARFLKEKNPAIRIVAVEPDTSAVLSGGAPGAHKIQGIGAGFIPKVLDVSLITDIVAVSAEDAGNAARECATKEGILCGISSGAALHAAIKFAGMPEFMDKTIVVILPDTGERYLSTWLFDE